MRIERVAHGVRLDLPGEIDMRHLAEGVHTGVGAARALDLYTLAAECLDRRRERALHGGAVRLDLPSGKRGAVIFEQELVARHDAQCSVAPDATWVPRRKSSAFMACLPARCSSTIRTAPAPHAIARRSSSTAPGKPVPSPPVVRRIRARAPSGSSHHAP